MQRPSIAVVFAIGAAAVAVAFALSVVVAGEIVTQAARGPVGPPPPDLPAVAVEFHTASKQRICGWMVPGQPGLGAVLLIHGVRADRRQMIGRARLLHRLGYSTLLIDLPAHGESSGNRITYGLTEAEAVSAALDHLARTCPMERLGVIGISLGAVSLVLSRPDPAPSAIVLESMFPTLGEAVSNRLTPYVGPAAALLAPSLAWHLNQRFGMAARRLRPIAALPALHAPVLIASGTADRYTTPAETQRVFAAANAPKELWWVDGAAHVDLYDFNPDAYASRISAFFARHLRSAG